MKRRQSSSRSKPSALRELADRLGIIPEYVDQTGTERRATSDATRRRLLGVMGVDASTDAAARRALEALEARERARLLPPARVAARGRDDLRAARATLPAGWSGGGAVEWALEVTEEFGRTHRSEGRAAVRRARGGGTPVADVPLPAELPLGYHTLRLTVRRTRATRRGGDGDDGGGAAEREATQTLVVAPGSCPRVEELLGGRRVFGLVANLYTVRSRRNWGAGDFTDLRELLRWGGEIGAAFVGVNPLHALRNAGGDVSPYSPVSRLFRNVLYVDVEAVPELGESEEAQRLVADAALRRELDRLRRGDRVEYERVMALKRPILEALHRAFRRAHGSSSTDRGAAYARFVERGGEPLADFARFLALDEHFAERGLRSWREWPEAYRAPRTDAVRRFHDEHPDAVDFHRWVQFELDRQLGAAVRAEGRGPRVETTPGTPLPPDESSEFNAGTRPSALDPRPFLYSDLAIGTSPDGYDTWAYGELFLQGASVGAPPDPYSADGQYWGLPPIDPRRLAEDGYRFWITLVRQALGHAGALRMDHVMGLFRQFWIPEGWSGKHGAYVRFPSEDLLGILALESARAGALVVGEDLGTVPPEVPPALERWGILSSKVLYFERDKRGTFRPAAKYPPRALATANTHDMATLEGFRRAADVELRERVGLASPKEAARARVERRTEVQQLLKRLIAEGVLPAPTARRALAGAPAAAELPGPVFRGAVHAFLCRTPCALVGLMLDDLSGEVEAVNAPGVSPDTFPSWTRKMRMSLEEMRESADVREALRTEGRGTRHAARGTSEPGIGAKDVGANAQSLPSETRTAPRVDALPTGAAR